MNAHTGGGSSGPATLTAGEVAGLQCVDRLQSIGETSLRNLLIDLQTPETRAYIHHLAHASSTSLRS